MRTFLQLPSLNSHYENKIFNSTKNVMTQELRKINVFSINARRPSIHTVLPYKCYVTSRKLLARRNNATSLRTASTSERKLTASGVEVERRASESGTAAIYSLLCAECNGRSAFQ